MSKLFQVTILSSSLSALFEDKLFNSRANAEEYLSLVTNHSQLTGAEIEEVETINTAAQAAKFFEDLSDTAKDFIEAAFESLKDPTPYEDEIYQSVYDYAANEIDGVNAYHVCQWLKKDPRSWDFMEEVVKEGLCVTSDAGSYKFYNHVCCAMQQQTEQDVFEDLTDIEEWFLYASIAKEHPFITLDAAAVIEDADLNRFDNWSDIKKFSLQAIANYSKTEDEE